MLKLDATTKSLEVVLSGAVTTTQLSVVYSYVEINQTTLDVTEMAGDGVATNNTTPVVVVAAPVAGRTRKVDFLTVVNSDTVAATVTLNLNDGGVLRPIIKVTLAVGDNLCYTG